jgi:hypothetical protein
MTTFYSGLSVKYRDNVGVVDFVCEKYITICINRLEHRSKDVCLLVYPEQWKEVQLLKQSEK